MPGVVLIAGSGPVDRDGSVPGLVNDHLKRLAEGLAERGVAVVRYDKRGAGGTPATADPVSGEEALTPATFAADAAAVAGKFAEDPRVGVVCLLGHSEGSLLALMVGGEPAVRAVVSIAGVGRPAAAVIREQLAGNLPPDLAVEAEQTLLKLEAGERAEDPPAALAALFRPSVQPYLIAWFAEDPAALAGGLEKPLLIVQGGRDVQVSVEDGRLLHAAAPGSEFLELASMNHVLRDVAEAESPGASYTQPERPLAAGLVDAIAGFVKRHAGG